MKHTVVHAVGTYPGATTKGKIPLFSSSTLVILGVGARWAETLHGAVLSFLREKMFVIIGHKHKTLKILCSFKYKNL